MNQKNTRSSKKSVVEKLQKQTEKTHDIQTLLESEAKYRGFIENLPVLFYAAEPQPPYAPIYLSPAFAQFGYSLEKWRETADLWTRIIHPEDREWVLEKTAAAMQAGEAIDYEYRIIAQNGAVFWVRDRSSFIRDEQGNSGC